MISGKKLLFLADDKKENYSQKLIKKSFNLVEIKKENSIFYNKIFFFTNNRR